MNDPTPELLQRLEDSQQATTTRIQRITVLLQKRRPIHEGLVEAVNGFDGPMTDWPAVLGALGAGLTRLGRCDAEFGEAIVELGASLIARDNAILALLDLTGTEPKSL
jgi:hypothetical protein